MISGTLTAAGGIGLFLLGMVVMTRGLKSLAGDALRRALTHFTNSPTSGAVTGATVTAVVQSSSATTVTAVGFVGTGLLSFSQAPGVIFGPNVDAYSTIGRLDTLRWLRRVAYHVWRIVHHLRRAQPENGIHEREEIPLHREHEPVD
jgi:hypothetical protein